MFVPRFGAIGAGIGAGVGAVSSANPYKQNGDGEWKKMTGNQHFKHIAKNTVLGGLAGGALGATVGGHAQGLHNKARNAAHAGQQWKQRAYASERDAKWWKDTASDYSYTRSSGPTPGAGSSGAGAGAGKKKWPWEDDDYGDFFGGAGGKSRARGGAGKPPPASEPIPDWLKGAKSKAEAKKAYRAAASQHHPDRGGDPEKMKKVNTDWEKWEGHFKTAMFHAFADELAKIHRNK